MQDDLIEPSNAEQAAWPDATRDYVHALEAKLAEKDALLRECGEALDDMLEYSMFNEAWQDRHPEYRTKAATTLTKIKDATDAD